MAIGAAKGAIGAIEAAAAMLGESGMGAWALQAVILRGEVLSGSGASMQAE